MAHEQSITVKDSKGRWVNISSMVDGKSAPGLATKLLLENKRKPLGGRFFESSKEAVEAAKKRSKSFDKHK